MQEPDKRKDWNWFLFNEEVFSVDLFFSLMKCLSINNFFFPHSGAMSFLVFLILLLAPWNAFLFMKLHLSGTNFCPRNLSFSGPFVSSSKALILVSHSSQSWLCCAILLLPLVNGGCFLLSLDPCHGNHLRILPLNLCLLVTAVSFFNILDLWFDSGSLIFSFSCSFLSCNGYYLWNFLHSNRC